MYKRPQHNLEIFLSILLLLPGYGQPLNLATMSRDCDLAFHLIFISVDDNEMTNLRRLCDEIFGEENFVAQMVWQKRTSPDARKKLSTGHEYILMYCKSYEQLNDAISLILR